MDESQRRKICQLVAGIVVTDDELDPREEAFVERMLARFGLDPSERDAIFPLVDGEEAARDLAKMPEDVRGEAFSLLVQAAAADDKVVPEEREYLLAVGRALGLSEDDVDLRIVDALSG